MRPFRGRYTGELLRLWERPLSPLLLVRRRAVSWRLGMGKGVDDALPGFLRRLQPSEVDVAMAWIETVDKEDKLRMEHYKREGASGFAVAAPPPKPQPLRDEMLSFATSHDRADWKAALADPQAAEAMRTLRSRVGALKANGRAALELRAQHPANASRLINAQAGGPSGSMFRTSNFNPLGCDGLEQGWDPRARKWTGRQGLSGLEKQPTSLWCPSWAASASHLGLDTNFVHVEPGKGKMGHDASMHSRGWR